MKIQAHLHGKNADDYAELLELARKSKDLAHLLDQHGNKTPAYHRAIVAAGIEALLREAR